jgi:hypothetical protein
VAPRGGVAPRAGLARRARELLLPPPSAIAWRIFLTVWLVYGLHFATNVVRETYLAITLGERLSVRVDEYLGLHPDLFEIPGRGGYINNNPGASMLGAVPYAVARPAIDGVLRAFPELARPKDAAMYDDPRPNRARFMNEARARGVDVKLALAAATMHAGLMAPLAALAAVVMFLFLRARLGDERRAMWLALLYAFGSPIFFRSAFLNQNAIVAHCVLFAFALLAWPRDRASPEAPAPPTTRALLGAGALMGLAVLCDYSGVPLILAFGVWALHHGWTRGRAAGAVRAGALFSLGAAGPLLVLLGYQWAAFGHPLYPAQRYMPATRYSVRGWNGMTVPTGELLLGNLFDPGYGLFAFSPVLLAALAAPFVRRPWRAAPGELGLVFGATIALLLFSSANQFALLQWNTGVRYMVPAAPLLFVALVPALLRMPAPLRWALVLPTLAVSWCVSMTRENVPLALARVFVGGFELPTLRVLQVTSQAYAPFLEHGTSPLPLFCLTGAVLWLLWRRARPAAR